jgi:hypothetical protein
MGVNSYAMTAGTSATADVVTPLFITQTSNMRFGEFTAGTGGSLTLNANTGARTTTGGVTTVGGGLSNLAQFTVTGDINGPSGYSVSLSGSSTSLDSGGDSMAVAFTASETGGNLTSGTSSFAVGGVLTIGASQAAGSYSGTINATVEYQ